MELTPQEQRMFEALRKQEMGRKKTGVTFIIAGVKNRVIKA